MMGLINGSAGFVRFAVDGELPDNAETFIAERIKAYSFQDIDESTDEYSIGWVSIVSMFDSSFSYASYRVGDYIILSLRIDERKISSAVMKKCIAKEEERIKKERHVPRLSRGVRSEIKQRLHAQLTAKAIPVPSVYDLCWNLSEGMVLFFSTNKKAHALLEDFFKKCFGLFVVQQIPYNTAERLLDNDRLPVLASLSPQLFI